MAVKLDLVIDQGATFSNTFVVADGNNYPTDLTGFAATAQMKKWYTSSNVVTITASVVNATAGSVRLSLTSNATTNIVPGRYVYDVEATSGSTVMRLREGIVTVTPGVTNTSVFSL